MIYFYALLPIYVASMHYYTYRPEPEPGPARAIIPGFLEARSSKFLIGPKPEPGPSPKIKSSISSKLDKFRPVAPLIFMPETKPFSAFPLN